MLQFPDSAGGRQSVLFRHGDADLELSVSCLNLLLADPPVQPGCRFTGDTVLGWEEADCCCAFRASVEGPELCVKVKLWWMSTLNVSPELLF